MRQWYRMVIRAQAGDAGADEQRDTGTKKDHADLFVYDAIGKSFWDEDTVTAKSFVAELAALPDTVRSIAVRVNSPGGDVFDAVAIHNALRDQRTKGRTVDAYIDGLAASAATIVMMAGERIVIADNAMVMIHNPFGVTVGNAEAHRKTADDLDTIRTAILASYRSHSPLSDAALIALMDAETWFDADEALEHGFATEKAAANLDAVASLEARAFARLSPPEQFRARLEQLVRPPAPADVMALCAAAGLDLPFAQSLLAAGVSLDVARARVEGERLTRQQNAAAAPASEVLALCAQAGLSVAFAQTLINKPLADVRAAVERGRTVAQLCDLAHVPELAPTYIASGMSIDAVKAQLVVITAKIDHIEIDGSLSVDEMAGRRDARGHALPTAREIYASRNAGVDQ